MPLAIAAVLRFVVMAALNTAVISSAQIIISEVYDKVLAILKSEEGMTDAEAEDSIAGEFIGIAGAFGANAVLIKSRLPMRLADKIARTAKPAAIAASGKANVAMKSSWLKKPLSQLSVKHLLIIGALGSIGNWLLWLPNLIQQILDQGTFNPKTANAAMRAIGLGSIFQWPENSKQLQPGTYTPAEFSELYDQLTAAGAVGINNEFEQQSQIWSKDNLAELTNIITGDLIIRGKKSDKNAIKSELTKYIISRTPSGGGGIVSPYSPTTGTTPPAGTVATQIKIYTGVVANGALGTPQEFVARPDDMIQNADELKTAAKINLAALYQALPGRFYYEIAIVSSIRTRAGFTVKGAPVQVVSGYLKNGQPRYKTVYHKFAVMRVFVTDRLGKNVKLEEITLGPVNVVDFQPSAAQLTDIAEKITPETFTGDIGDVKQIITSGAVAVTPTSQYTPTPTPAPAGGTVSQPVTPVVQQPAYVAPATPPPAPPPVQVSSPAPAPAPVAAPSIAKVLPLNEAAGVAYSYGSMGTTSAAAIAQMQGVALEDLLAVNTKWWQGMPLSGFTNMDITTLMRNYNVPPVNIPFPRSGSSAPANTRLAAATNLSEAYIALGKDLAPLATRASLYQSWGLGASSTYAGTAEQNAKLLAEIKKRGAVS